MVEAGRVTTVIDGDISQLKASMDQAKQLATSTASEIEKDVSSSLSGGFSGVSDGLKKSLSGGNASGIGKELGGSLVDGVTSSLGPLGGVASSVATALGPVGMVGIGAAAGLLTIGSASVTTAANFEQSMARVNSVLGGGKEQFETLSAAAREAGATTTFSASGAADGLYYLASAGYNTVESTTALKDVLNLAAADGMELGRAAEMVTTDLAVFGLGADQAGRLTNLLAAAASSSNSGVAQMGDAMAKVGGTANTLNMSLEQTGAVLAVMANGGKKGSEAGTQLNAILGQLMVASSSMATKNQANAMAEMGITADQLNPKLHSQAEIFGLLNEKQMTGAQSLALFGLENNASASYIAANAGKINELEKTITGTSKASEMAAMQSATYQGAMKELASAVEEAQICIGNLLLPVLTSSVKWLTDATNAATDFGKGLSEITGIGQEGGLSLKLHDATGGLLGLDLEQQAAVKAANDAEFAAANRDLGDTAAKGIATGIKENKELKTAPADALSDEAAKAALKKSAEEDAKAWVKDFGRAMEAGMTQTAPGIWQSWESIANQGGTSTTNKGRVVTVGPSSRDYAADIVGTTKIGGFDFVLDSHNYLTLPDGSKEFFTGSADLAERLVSYIENYTGAAMTDLQKAELRDDIQEQVRLNVKTDVEIESDSFLAFADNLKSEMEGAGTEINEAFLKGLTPDSASIESRLENIRRLKLYDPEEARKQGADNAIAYLTSLKDALDSYEKAKVKYLAEPDNENSEAALDLALGNLQAKIDQNPLKVKIDADTSLFNTRMDDLAGSVDLKKLISDPAAFKASVMDIPEFMENTWQPAMMKEIDFFKTQWHSGLGAAQQDTEDFLDAMVSAANNMPLLFSSEQIGILYEYANGLISTEAAIDGLSGSMDKLAEKTKEANVGWDALGKTISDTSECALSDFAKWQEGQSDLFSGSYIGQGGAQYLDWKLPYMQRIADTQAAMKLVGGSVLGEDYTQRVQEIKMKLSVDKTEADTAITDIETKAKKEQKIPLKVDDIEAKTTLTAVEKEAQKARTMPLKIDDRQAKAAIRGIDAAASRPVTKIVYVKEVGGGGGGSSYWGPGPNTLDDSLFGDWDTFPSYGAGDVFVPQPTLAVVGDRPGGEWIGGLDQAAARFGGSGKAGNIVVNYSPTIYSTMGKEELAELLEEHDEKLIAKIAAEKLR